jgi:hypothetical protein
LQARVVSPGERMTLPGDHERGMLSDYLSSSLTAAPRRPHLVHVGQLH